MAERAVATTKTPETKQKCSNSGKQNVGFNSSGSTADRILQLQRTAGNQAVQKLIKSRAFQAKLRIGQPNDVYEQEADRVAEQVMRMPEPLLQRHPAIPEETIKEESENWLEERYLEETERRLDKRLERWEREELKRLEEEEHKNVLIQRKQAGPELSTPSTPCPTSVRIGSVVQHNHSDLSPPQKERYRTYLEAMSRMDVLPGPNHTGHCMKERLITVSNNCPQAVYIRRGREGGPCSDARCLGINQYAPHGRIFYGLSDGPTSFIDMHITRNATSLLEGTGVNSCSFVCEQTYTCDRIHPTTGTFLITRNYQAGNYIMPDGSSVHITTGNVTKTQR
jgi:hypothetical protein